MVGSGASKAISPARALADAYGVGGLFSEISTTTTDTWRKNADSGDLSTKFKRDPGALLSEEGVELTRLWRTAGKELGEKAAENEREFSDMKSDAETLRYEVTRQFADLATVREQQAAIEEHAERNGT